MNRIEDESIYVGEGDVDHEGCIVGTPEGLKELRDHIDRALAEGDSEISADGIEWSGVVRIERAPERAPVTWRSRLLEVGCGFGCIVFLLSCVVLMLLGIGRLKDLLTK